MNLFELGEFTLASGQKSDYKIECDALTDEDIETCAYLLSQRLPPFKEVIGVPKGGMRLAAALEKYIDTESVHRIYADDVYTTGKSILNVVKPGNLLPDHNWTWQAAVIFARPSYVLPGWVTPLFTLSLPSPVIDKLIYVHGTDT